MPDLHPGHDPKIVDEIIAQWREEFGVADGTEHVGFIEFGDGAHEVKPLTMAGTVLVDRLIAAGILGAVQ